MRTGPQSRNGRRARRTVLGRPLPSRSTVTSLTVVLVLSIVPVAVPLLVMRNDASRSLAGGTPAGAVPAPGPPVGRTPSGQPTLANSNGSGLETRTPTPAPTTSRPPDPAPGPTGSPRSGPNLVVVSVTWTPVDPRTGDRMTFTAVVRNIGDRPSPDITHGIGFLVDNVTVAWSGASSTPIPPGAERTYVADEGDTGPPFWTATKGGHELTVYADDINRFPETNEDNNRKSVQFGVVS